jgi:glycine hydroxymethyltransferase
MSHILKKYTELYNEFLVAKENTIPLCAAENYISEFSKQPLTSEFEGMYSCINIDGTNSFLEGNYIERLKKLIQDECKLLFNSNYTNTDTLTGINCFTVCAMSLLNCNDNVLLTTPEQGGHPSIPIILDSLQVNYDAIPYDYNNYQIDYDKLNILCDSNKYSYIIFCQSDLLNVPDLNKINMQGLGVIYDATQSLGLILGKCITNPLDYNNTVLIGGTHKTLPAPSCGLIMTNNSEYALKLNKNISPVYLRNTQPNHMASMLLALCEQEKFGTEYQQHIVYLANHLASALEKYGFTVAKSSKNNYTYTHQIFILMTENDAKSFYQNSTKYNVSLNIKNKKLFNNYGIRLGVQQIAQYNWQNEEIAQLARLLFLIKTNPNSSEINKLRNILISKKIPHFSYDCIAIE